MLKTNDPFKLSLSPGHFHRLSPAPAPPHGSGTMAAYYTFEDYSGASTPNKSDNPYDGLIEACSSDPVRACPLPEYLKSH